MSTNSFMRVRAAKLARAAKVQAKRFDRELNTIKLPKITQKTVFTLSQVDKDKEKINILSVKNLDFAYDKNKSLFSNLNFDVYTGDRVAIVGQNGSGKSTLMKILTGEIKAAHGLVNSTELKFYLPQEIRIKNPKQTVLDYLTIESNMTEAELGKILGKVLFVNPKNLRLGDLSQGQLKRILVIVMLLTPSSVLFLDEPTNHLDIPTMESFEFALKKYPGAIIAISHDKYFLDSLGVNKEIFLANK
jgi:ATP-binding cassette subfamily F protein 3